MADEHPLALELSSLRAALDKYQHAAHVSHLQIQRANLKASDVSAHLKSLEAENARLKEEVAFLRANPEHIPVPRQVTELDLETRRLSDKLSLTENILLQKLTDLSHAESEGMRMKLEANATLAEIERVRRRENEILTRQRDLQRKCRAAEEEARMTDVVVMEYADLVRSLEAKSVKVLAASDESDDKLSRAAVLRSQALEDTRMISDCPLPNDDSESPTRTSCLVQSLTENRFSLQRLLHEFNAENASLQAEITRLHAELSTLQHKLDTEREISKADEAKLAEALVELERCKTDDKAAGNLVSRYMQFSQSSIDNLHVTISTLKSRHAATIATLSGSSEAFSEALALERSRVSALRDTLDQLTEDISRETSGRRREVALRLRSIVREERMAEALNTWLRRAEDRREKMALATSVEPSSGSSSGLITTFDSMIDDAHVLLDSLSGECGFTTKPPESTPWGRIILAENICKSLLSELHEETEKRLTLTRALGDNVLASPPIPSHGDIIDPVNIPDGADLHIKHILSEVACAPSLGEKSPASDPIPLQQIMTQSHTTSDVPNGTWEIVDTSDLSNKRETVEIASSHTETSSEVSSLGQAYITPQHCNVPPPDGPISSLHSHPLLNKLTYVSHRYDRLQHAFRDCHLALTQLKSDITSGPFSRPGIPTVQSAIHRLDDFCEDARVELEIRMTDEERIARGFETMLRVPGSLAAGTELKTYHDLQSFVDGTAPTIVKTIKSYTTKLTDLQHDIAQITRTMQEIETTFEMQFQPAKSLPPWSSWTPPFLKSAGSHNLPPTFGTVITTPQSSHVSSTPSSPYAYRASNELEPSIRDPYSFLKLRIPMPPQIPADTLPLQLASLRLRNRSSSNGIYLLGLGGSTSGFLSKHNSNDVVEYQLDRESEDMEQIHSDVE